MSGRRGRGRRVEQPAEPQDPHTQALRDLTTALLQAGVGGNRGGSTALQQFKAHHPPIYSAEPDPLIAERWINRIERILDAMEIANDATRINLVPFQLEGEAHNWWDLVKRSLDLTTLLWDEFKDLFLGKYFPQPYRQAMILEFLDLKQRDMTVMQYEQRFTELARHATYYVTTEIARVRKFKNGLRFGLRHKLVPLNLQRYSELVDRAVLIEKDLEEMRASRDEEGKRKKKSSQASGGSSGKSQKSSSSSGRNQTWSSSLGPRGSKGKFKGGHSRSSQQQTSSFVQNSANDGNVVCFNCGYPGHKQWNCLMRDSDPAPVPAF